MNKTAHCLIFNKEGEILCVSRKNDHNDFGIAGGKFEANVDESILDTAIRETFEETGIKVLDTDPQLLLVIHKYGFMSYTFLIENWEGEFDYDEPHVVKWGTWDDLVKGSFGKYNKLLMESYNDYIKNSNK